MDSFKSEQLIDGTQIRVLLKIVETGSFSAAAAALDVTQPSISQHVRRVEAAIGRPLFRRKKSGVELTRDGDAAIIYARAMVGLSKELKERLARNAGHIKISVGMSEDFCRTALPSVLGLFAREHKHVELRVISGSYSALLDAIDEEQVDIAVLRRNARFPEMTHLWSEDLVWVGRDDLDLPVNDPVPLCTPIDNPARDAAIATLKQAGRRWRIAFESNSLASIEAALQARLGVACWTRSMRYYGVAHLGAESGLPPLPKVDFVMHGPPSDADPVSRAFAAVLRASAESGYELNIQAIPYKEIGI